MPAKLSTGINYLDSLLEGGLTEGRVYVVSGPPGSGKTTFGMQFLSAGARLGDRGLFVCTSSKPKSVVADVAQFNFNIIENYKAKRILFLDMTEKTPFPSKERRKYMFYLERINEVVATMNVKRVVIDSIGPLVMHLKKDQMAEEEIYLLLQGLQDIKATFIITSEMNNFRDYGPEDFYSSGLIYLHHFLQEKEMVRAIQVMKMRGSKVDSDMRELQFNSDGLSVSSKLIMVE